MKYSSTLSSTFTAAVLGLCVFSAAQAQTKWDMPTPYSDGTFHTVVIRQFVSEVKTATASSLDVTVHSNASLIKHPDILRAVQTGQVPMGEILLSQFANEDPMFEADNLPFLASGWDNAAKLYKAHKKYVEDRMMKRGIRVLYSVPWAGQGLYTKKPVLSGNDLVGIKFRAYNPSTAKLAELLKMTPTTVTLDNASAGIQEIPVNEIMTILFDEEPPELTQARINARNGGYATALDALKKIEVSRLDREFIAQAGSWRRPSLPWSGVTPAASLLALTV